MEKTTKMRLKTNSLIRNTLLLYLSLLKSINSAGITKRVVYSKVSKQDKITFEIPIPAEKGTTGTEDTHIKYTSSNPTVLKIFQTNYQPIYFLGPKKCSVLKKYPPGILPRSTDTTFYALCNSDHIVSFRHKKTGPKATDFTIDQIRQSSLKFDTKKIRLASCLSFVVYTDQITKKKTIKILCKMEDVEGASTYKITSVTMGQDFNISKPTDNNNADFLIQASYPLEPSPKMTVLSLRFTSDGKKVDQQCLVFYRIPEAKQIKDFVDFNNHFLRYYNLRSNREGVLEFEQGLLQANRVKFLTDIYFVDSTTFLLSGYLQTSKFLMTIYYKLPDVTSTPTAITRYENPNQIQRGWMQVKPYIDSKDKKSKIFAVYADYQRGMIGICNNLLLTGKGFVGACDKIEFLAELGVSSGSFGCLDQTGCFFAYKKADFSSNTGFMLFKPAVKNLPQFSMSTPGLVKLLILDRGHIMGIDSLNWAQVYLLAAKRTRFLIDLSKETRQNPTYTVSQAVHDPKSPTKKVVINQYNYQVDYINNLFGEINAPETIPNMFWYKNEYMRIYTSQKYWEGNALEFAASGSNLTSVVIKNNQINAFFKEKTKPGFTKIPFGKELVHFNGTRISYYECSIQAGEQFNYFCSQRKSTIVNGGESIVYLGVMNDLSSLVITKDMVPGRNRARLIFNIQGTLIQQILRFNINLFDLYVIDGDLIILMVIDEVLSGASKSFLLKLFFKGTKVRSIDKFEQFKTEKQVTPTTRFECLTGLQYDQVSQWAYFLENCGPNFNKVHRLKISDKGEYSHVSTMTLTDELFSDSLKGRLRMCVHKEQVLLVELGTKNIKLTRYGFLKSSQDLGFGSFAIEKIVKVYCPKYTSNFLVLVEMPVPPEKPRRDSYFKMITFTWESVQKAQSRILSISDYLMNVTKPEASLIVHSNKQYYFSYSAGLWDYKPPANPGNPEDKIKVVTPPTSKTSSSSSEGSETSGTTGATTSATTSATSRSSTSASPSPTGTGTTSKETSATSAGTKGSETASKTATKKRVLREEESAQKPASRALRDASDADRNAGEMMLAATPQTDSTQKPGHQNHQDDSKKKPQVIKGLSQVYLSKLLTATPPMLLVKTNNTKESITISVTNPSSKKPIQRPLKAEFEEYKSNIDFNHNNKTFYIQERDYKLKDISVITGHVLSILKSGSEKEGKIVTYKPRIRFEKNFKESKNNTAKALRVFGDFSDNSVPNDTKLFDFFKEMKFKYNVIVGLTDLQGQSRVYIYNNTDYLAKRIDMHSICRGLDFDMDVNDQNVVVFSVCKVKIGKALAPTIAVKTTNIDAFVIGDLSYYGSTIANYTQISGWIGRDYGDLIVIGFNRKGDKSLQMIRIDMKKAKKDPATNSVRFDYQTLWSIDRGERLDF